MVQLGQCFPGLQHHLYYFALRKPLLRHARLRIQVESSIVEFIASLARLSGINHPWRAKGLMIFNLVPEAADGLPGPAIASPPTDPASQPSDEASAITEELSAAWA